MSPIKPSHSNDAQPQQPQRRQLLAAAATLGVAPWLLSACASAATSPAVAPKAAGMRRKIGPFEVFPVGLGCQWRPGAAPGVIVDSYSSSFDRAAAIRLIRQAVDQGVTFIDTAEAYGPFLSEDIVGEALQGIRNKVVLETKFGFDIDQVTGQRLPGGRNSRPEHIRRVVDAQLKRLRTDHIDVLCSTGWTRTCRSKTWPAPSRISSAPARCGTTACRSRACRPCAARMRSTRWR